jgi:hypothetical protein
MQCEGNKITTTDWRLAFPMLLNSDCHRVNVRVSYIDRRIECQCDEKYMGEREVLFGVWLCYTLVS